MGWIRAKNRQIDELGSSGTVWDLPCYWDGEGTSISARSGLEL